MLHDTSSTTTLHVHDGIAHAAESRSAADGRCVLVPRDLLMQMIASAARVDPRLHADLVACAEVSDGRESRRRPTALTRREHEVLDRLARGRSYKQIGADLAISIDTVRTYVRTLYRKLSAHSVTEAIASARRLGLVGQPGAEPVAAKSEDDVRLF